MTTICPFFLCWLQLVCPEQMGAGFSPASGYVCNISSGVFQTAFWEKKKKSGLADVGEKNNFTHFVTRGL